MHTLRFLSALVLSDPERMTRHREFLIQRPPPIVNWSRVSLIALFLSLPATVAGQYLLVYPESWMGAVVGAAAGYPAGLLCALVLSCEMLVGEAVRSHFMRPIRSSRWPGLGVKKGRQRTAAG